MAWTQLDVAEEEEEADEAAFGAAARKNGSKSSHVLTLKQLARHRCRTKPFGASVEMYSGS